MRYYGRFKKDVDDKLSYTWNFRKFLRGDTIVSYTLTTTLTVVVSINDATSVSAIISGGVYGQQYDVTCRITTLGGQQKDATIQLTIDQE